jgi:hypothetical protein
MKNVTFEETVDTLPDGAVRGKLIRYIFFALIL